MNQLPKKIEKELLLKYNIIYKDEAYCEYIPLTGAGELEIYRSVNDNELSCILVKELRLQMTPLVPDIWVCWCYPEHGNMIVRAFESKDYCECVFEGVRKVYGAKN